MSTLKELRVVASYLHVAEYGTQTLDELEKSIADTLERKKTTKTIKKPRKVTTKKEFTYKIQPVKTVRYKHDKPIHAKIEESSEPDRHVSADVLEKTHHKIDYENIYQITNPYFDETATGEIVWNNLILYFEKKIRKNAVCCIIGDIINFRNISCVGAIIDIQKKLTKLSELMPVVIFPKTDKLSRYELMILKNISGDNIFHHDCLSEFLFGRNLKFCFDDKSDAGIDDQRYRIRIYNKKKKTFDGICECFHDDIGMVSYDIVKNIDGYSPFSSTKLREMKYSSINDHYGITLWKIKDKTTRQEIIIYDPNEYITLDLTKFDETVLEKFYAHKFSLNTEISVVLPSLKTEEIPNLSYIFDPLLDKGIAIYSDIIHDRIKINKAEIFDNIVQQYLQANKDLEITDEIPTLEHKLYKTIGEKIKAKAEPSDIELLSLEFYNMFGFCNDPNIIQFYKSEYLHHHELDEIRKLYDIEYDGRCEDDYCDRKTNFINIVGEHSTGKTSLWSIIYYMIFDRLPYNKKVKNVLNQKYQKRGFYAFLRIKMGKSEYVIIKHGKKKGSRMQTHVSVKKIKTLKKASETDSHLFKEYSMDKIIKGIYQLIEHLQYCVITNMNKTESIFGVGDRSFNMIISEMLNDIPMKRTIDELLVKQLGTKGEDEYKVIFMYQSLFDSVFWKFARDKLFELLVSMMNGMINDFMDEPIWGIKNKKTTTFGIEVYVNDATIPVSILSQSEQKMIELVFRISLKIFYDEIIRTPENKMISLLVLDELPKLTQKQERSIKRHIGRHWKTVIITSDKPLTELSTIMPDCGCLM